jgi:hypothetical protein
MSDNNNRKLPYEEILTVKNWKIPDLLHKGGIFSMLVVGSRRSGKSNFIKHLFKECKFKKYYEHILVFCNSDDVEDFYSEFVPGNLFFKDFDEDIFINIFRQSGEYKKSGNPKKYLVIFDDSVGWDQKNADSIMQIYNTGRHHNVSIIFCSQRLFLTNTSARCNSDVVLIGRSKSAGEMKYIIDTFLKGTMEQREIPPRQTETSCYYYLIRNYTANYNFLILDTSNDKSNNFFDTVFEYKAPDMTKKKIK